MFCNFTKPKFIKNKSLPSLSWGNGITYDDNETNPIYLAIAWDCYIFLLDF